MWRDDRGGNGHEKAQKRVFVTFRASLWLTRLFGILRDSTCGVMWPTSTTIFSHAPGRITDVDRIDSADRGLRLGWACPFVLARLGRGGKRMSPLRGFCGAVAGLWPDCSYWSQSSTVNPLTRENSVVLLVTSVAPCKREIAAI
jgi:hypothetical protein